MSSLLAQHMSRLRNEAKTNFKSNIIYFLDAPNLEHLGFKAKIIGTPKEYQESLLRLNGTELHQEITSASQLIDEKVKFINNIISDFINQKLDLKVKLVNEQLVAHDPDTASKLRLLEINSFLAQQCKLKGSVYFLNSLKAYLQIYPIAYLLQTQGYEDSKLNLDAPVLSSFNSEQKERIKRMSLLFSKSNDACARLSLTAKFAKALCGQNDLGIIYGCALLGLDGLLSSFNELLSLHPNLEVESFINQLAKSFKNEHPVALLRFKDFLVSDSFIRFSSTKNDLNQNQNHPAHQQQRPHAPYIANKSNKGLILTVASDHDATTPAPHGLVLTNAAASAPASEQANNSNSQQDKSGEPLAKNKTAKAAPRASGLVLTNAADSQSDSSSNSQQNMGNEPLRESERKDAKTSASASGLVLTNTADSVQDNSSNSQQNMVNEPVRESERKDAKTSSSSSGLVLTNAADSVQGNSNSKQDKGSEPLAETKTVKASASASGLVLTNAADAQSDSGSNDLQDKGTEPLAENKTAKASASASGLVLTNAADSLQDNSSNSLQDKGTEPLSETKTAKASANASGLVLTNAADSQSDSGSNSQQDKDTEPLVENKTAKESASSSGLVLTNAADSVQENSSTSQQDKSTEHLRESERKDAKTSASASGLVLTNAAAIIQEGSKGNSVKTNFSGEQSANLLITTEQYEQAPISKEELFVQNFYSRNLQAIPNVSEKSFSQRAQERYLSILDRIDNNAKENDGKKVFRVAKSIKEEAIKDTSSPEQVNDASKVNSDKQDQAPKVQVIWKTMDGSQPNFEAKTQETTAKASTEALPQGSGHESGSNVEKAAITTAVSTASTEDKGTTKAAVSTATATAAAAATATETGVTVVKSATGIETKDDSISKNSEDTIISRVTGTSDIVTEDSKPKVKAKSAKSSGTTKKKTTSGLKRIKLSNASAGDIWQQAVDLAKDMDSEGSKVLTKEEFKASMETQEQATTSMVTTATTGESVDKATLSQSASNGAIKTDAVTEEMGSKGTASDNSTSNTGKSMPTGTAFMPFEQARRSNIKVLASRHVNDQVIEKDQAAVKIHKGSSSNIGKINPADALRHFDPITGSYIDERPVESEVEVKSESDFNQDSGQFFDNDSLNFDENLIFGDDETFEIWSPDEPNNKDDNQFNEETDLNLDKTLECSNELMRLKYTVLFAQSFLLDQEQYQKLMSAKNLEQLNMYSQLMSSFDDFSELNIEHTSALPNWQTIRASLLTQVINDMPNMPAYKSVLFDLLSRTKDEELSLTKQLAKFNYYNRVIGHTWEVEANNPQGPYANKEQASLAKFENSPGATFILACLFLNISQLHNYACDCFLGSAYTNCGLASPI